MNEWKELQIDNLPSDIWKIEKYDFYWKTNGSSSIFNLTTSILRKDIIIDFLNNLNIVTQGLMYRKPEPKAPSHEEIMTKWWFIAKSLLWKRVETMNIHCEYFITGTGWLHRSWFIDKKSADIPPE